MPLRGKQGRTCAVKGAGRGAQRRVACGAGGPVMSRDQRERAHLLLFYAVSKYIFMIHA